ncbi:hypothetical protein V8B97DRAFT_1868240 [Scleroderma yunnanense]
MSQSLDAQHEEMRRRIRSLTSMLHKFTVKQPATKQLHDISPLLRHSTTLLTCDDVDSEMKNVIAVTGSISPGRQVRVLIVSQNPHLTSSVQDISLKVVQKGKRSLNEMMTGYCRLNFEYFKCPSSPGLTDHIADVWAALSSFDALETDNDDQMELLELFFLTRSYRNFTKRFRGDCTLFGGKRLLDVISQWRPDPRRHEIGPRWVVSPQWLLCIEGLPVMKSRIVNGQLEWEFSDDTKGAWSIILGVFLRAVDCMIENVKSAKGEEKVREAMIDLNYWCIGLYCLITWKAGIVKSLLTRTDMIDSITTASMPVKAAGDADLVELELGESKGEQVYRYLESVIAWQAALNYLSTPSLLKLLKTIEIGLIEVPRSPSSVLTLHEIVDEFFLRYPHMIEDRQDVVEALETHYSDTFSGCIHASATLMGLVGYYGDNLMHKSHDVGIENPEVMQWIVQPMPDAGEAVIAVSKKCCWCCDWLGRRLKTRFVLPGTHGIMYPWDPPKFGVSVSLLKRLEEELWKELYQAVENLVEPSHSQHSFRFHSPRWLSMRQGPVKPGRMRKVKYFKRRKEGQ